MSTKLRSSKLVAVAAAGALALAACGGSSGSGAENSEGEQVITIGEIGSLTGPVAGTYGIPTHDGLEFALGQIEESGFLDDVGVSIKLDAKDSGSEVPNAVTIFNEFVRDGVFLTIVGTLSTINLAVAPLSTNSKTVVVANAGVGTTEPDYEFHVADVVTPAKSLADYIVSQGKKRVAIVVDGDNEAFVVQADTIEEELKAQGVSGFVSKDTVSSEDSDFSSVLSNARNSDPDAIVLATVDVMGGNILRQMSQLGGFDSVLKTGVIGWSAPAYETGGAAVEGVVFPTLWAPGHDKTNFESDWKSAHPDKVPGPYHALGSQIMWLYATAIRDVLAAGEDVTADTIADALPAASTSEDLAKNAPLVDFSVNREGVPMYPGSIATFGADGEITATTD